MTKKKKNTYIIRNKVMSDLNLFSLCRFTPLPVIEINGQKQENSTGWMSSTQFPNPAAHNLIIAFEQLKPVMGERLASTIVEYLDKDSLEPVALLFPTNEIMFRGKHDEFMKRLNHASRQDLKRQQKIRENYLQLVRNKQR